MTASVTSSDPEWNIQSGALACATCERAFADGEGLFTRLILSAQAYQRADHCEACWSPELRAASTSFWKTQFKPPPPRKEELLKKETVEDSLRAFVEEGDPAHTNTIFVLALMLERKRILVEKDVQVQEDGRRLRMYEHKASGEAFVIIDPNLRLEKIVSVQEEVATLLGWRDKPLAEPERRKVSDRLLVGMQVETSHEIEQSEQGQIPGLWERFAEGQLADTVPDRIPESPVYAAYSNYSEDASGYVFTAGVAIESGSTPPDELAQLAVVEGDYLVFPLEDSAVDDVRNAWSEIHRFFSEHPEITRAFSVDYEAYLPDGSLMIYVSVLPEKPGESASTGDPDPVNQAPAGPVEADGPATD